MMPNAKSLVLHGTLLLLAVGSAGYAGLRDKQAGKAMRGDVSVWKGKPADLERVELTKKGRTVVLETRKDAVGLWWFGTTEAEPTSPGKDQGTATRTTFMSVGAGQKLAEKLADFRAVRELGRLDDEKAAELGLKEPETLVKITLRGETRTLDLGALAPGAGDRYVRDAKTGTTFVVEAESLRDLESAERTLIERDVHEFQMDPDVDRVVVSMGEAKRTLLRRGPASGRFYADASAPEKSDETATTWLTKVERLRPIEFVAGEPPAPVSAQLRVEYFSTRASLGFIEVARAAGDDFFIRSERLRLWSKVVKSQGEQVFTDAASVVK
jgi:hypothetical protein